MFGFEFENFQDFSLRRERLDESRTSKATIFDGGFRVHTADLGIQKTLKPELFIQKDPPTAGLFESRKKKLTSSRRLQELLQRPERRHPSKRQARAQRCSPRELLRRLRSSRLSPWSKS